MIELVTWSPRVGSTGLDRFDLPGTTGLAGSPVAGGPTRISYGDLTKAANQVVEEMNTRASWLVADGVLGSFGTIPMTPFSDGEKIPIGRFQSLYNNIGSVVSVEGPYPSGYSPYSQPPAGLTKILGSHLAGARFNLMPQGTLSRLVFLALAPGVDWLRSTTGATWSQVSSSVVGWTTASATPRSRYVGEFYVPRWLNNASYISSAAYTFSAGTLVGGPVASVYTLATNTRTTSSAERALLPVDTATLCGSVTVAAGTNNNSVSVPAATIVANAGKWLKFMLVGAAEYAVPIGGASPGNINFRSGDDRLSITLT